MLNDNVKFPIRNVETEYKQKHFRQVNGISSSPDMNSESTLMFLLLSYNNISALISKQQTNRPYENKHFTTNSTNSTNNNNHHLDLFPQNKGEEIYQVSQTTNHTKCQQGHKQNIFKFSFCSTLETNAKKKREVKTKKCLITNHLNKDSLL